MTTRLKVSSPSWIRTPADHPGVWGVAHVATIFGQTPDLISQVVDTNQNLLTSAAGERTIKRFMYTSSSEAAVFTSSHEHRSTERTNITIDTWNEEALRRIKQNSTQGPKGGFDMYAASKTLGEQAIWKWAEEHRPGFVVNTGMYISTTLKVITDIVTSSPLCMLRLLNRPRVPGTCVVISMAGGHLFEQI